MNEDRYFATLTGPEYLDELVERINIWRKFLFASGTAAKWGRALRNYYGRSSDGSKSTNMLLRGGQQGEKVIAAQGDFRSLVRRKIMMATSQRPAGQAKAMTSDTRARHAARVASAVTEHYLTQVGFEKEFQKACECTAAGLDEGFVFLNWDANLGFDVRPNPETNRMIRSGDVMCRVVWPWNAARDPGIESADQAPWWIATIRDNKWDWVASFPEFRSEILGEGQDSNRKLLQVFMLSKQIGEDHTDQVDIHFFIHEKCPALPQGRFSVFVNDALLIDSPFPYDELNLYRMSEADVIDDSRGYSQANDLLASEEATQNLVSILLTNNLAFGGQSIVSPKGAGLVASQIAKGLTLFEIEAAMCDKIRPLQLTKSAPETFELLKYIDDKKVVNSGLNSVARGNPDEGLRSNSGAALALIAAQAIESNQDLQKAYYQLLSKAMTGLIEITRRNAKEEMIARLVGKAQRDYLKSYTYSGSTFQSDQGEPLIGAITYEPVNPLFQTTSGRLQVAESLMQKGLIKNPQTYLTLLMTGSFDSVVQDDENDQDLILQENEALRENGTPHRAVSTENHARHIASHMSVLSSPEAKADQDLVARVLGAVKEHLDQWQELSQTNPALLIATKQDVLPSAPPPGPGMPPGPQGGPAPRPAPPQIADNTPKQVNQASQVRLPSPPKNPMTGDEAPVAGLNAPA